MSSAVLDASAVLAYVYDEPGAPIVAVSLRDAVVSAVNAAEVVTKLMERDSPGRAREDFRRLRLEIAPFDLQQAYLVADLRAPTRAFGLSLGDRACLALARTLRLPALTADGRWSEVDVGVEVRLIR